eukprot:7061059-Alexandrium_andersonii.AAC.1
MCIRDSSSREARSWAAADLAAHALQLAQPVARPGGAAVEDVARGVPVSYTHLRAHETSAHL